MRHNELTDSGRTPHREIDLRLPTRNGARTLLNLLQSQELEIIASGNTAFDQDDNWRLRINSSGNLVLEKRESGSWINKHTWT